MLRLCAPAALFLSSCATLTTPPPITSPANEFATTIASFERSDPNSPAVLSVRLSYAESLLSSDEGPCEQRIESAQQELDQVEASPETAVMFPEGWPRTVELEYRLHLGRADCLGDSDRDGQLRAAVAAARHAAELYAGSFDYPAAAIMQFNTAVVLHQLGDSTGAFSALEATLAMDREFGFGDDARDNYKLLLTWQGRATDDAQVAALMQGFPARQAVLHFAWHAQQNHVALEDSRDCLWDGVISHSHAAASYGREIAADSKGGWKVTYLPGAVPYEPGVWPTLEGSAAPNIVFPPADIARPNFTVSATGAFVATTNSEALAAQLVSQTDGLIHAHAPADQDASALTKAALDTTAITLSSGLLVAAAAENHQIETSMWTGATLDQGVWYQLSAPLSLRGLSRVVVQQRLEFAFTRMVPCTATAREPICVELVVRTTPDQQAVNNLIKSYTSSTATRIVMDPATLLAYSREDRLYWYASIGNGPKDMTLQSEHFKSTTSD
ncbi:MAG TPA: hypothetical protein VGV09_13550 [Steroidobacteraceae bacterium]|nr:hypothetical protein [Steroidobacteraceae bacterium]